MAVMFDVEGAIKESTLPAPKIDRLKRGIRKEFPNDEMMYELHLIRALRIYSRRTTVIKKKA